MRGRGPGNPIWSAEQQRLLDSLGGVVKQRRADLGISQQQLADAVGCTVPMIAAIEHGRSLPGLALFSGMCRELCLCADEALEG